MNKLYVGFNREVELPERGFLFIGDEVPELPQARIFDPLKHSFNPLRDLDYKKARALADIFYTISPQGENTLTVRNGKRALLDLLMDGARRLDKVKPNEWKNAGKKEEEANAEALAAIGDVLVSPMLRKVLCSPPPDFSFNPRSTILARINRAELGDFDALALGLFLMAHYKGQVVVPDFGFYGRDAHVSLIRQKRLIAGVNVLAELPPRLRQAVALIGEKEAAGATFEDAELLARYARLMPGTNGFTAYVQHAMA